MTSNEFKKLIGQHIGVSNMASSVPVSQYNLLKPILENELNISLSSAWNYTNTFIDLWRSVNKELEKKSTNNSSKKGKGKGKGKKIANNSYSTTSSVSLRRGSSSLPVNLKLAKKLQELSDKIASDESDLDDYLDEIQNAEPTIDIGRYLGMIVKPSDVEKSIYEVYSSLCEYVVTCGNAIQSCNGNIANILELIRVLTAAEADLYNLLDDQRIESNELKVLIKEWCREHGIHDDEVDKLLETSFRRAYTLRDRINELRLDCYKKIDSLESRLDPIIEKITDYQNDIKLGVESALKDINKKVEKQKEAFSNLVVAANKEIKENASSQKKDLTLLVDNARKDINESLKHKQEELESFYKGKLIDLKKIYDEYVRILAETENRIEKLTENLNEKEKHLNDCLDSYLQTIKEKEESLDEQYKEVSEAFKDYISQSKKETSEFIDNQIHLYEEMKKQQSMYKIISISAIAISIVSILCAFLIQ